MSGVKVFDRVLRIVALDGWVEDVRKWISSFTERCFGKGRTSTRDKGVLGRTFKINVPEGWTVYTMAKNNVGLIDFVEEGKARNICLFLEVWEGEQLMVKCSSRDGGVIVDGARLRFGCPGRLMDGAAIVLTVPDFMEVEIKNPYEV